MNLYSSPATSNAPLLSAQQYFLPRNGDSLAIPVDQAKHYGSMQPPESYQPLEDTPDVLLTEVQRVEKQRRLGEEIQTLDIESADKEETVESLMDEEWPQALGDRTEGLPAVAYHWTSTPSSTPSNAAIVTPRARRAVRGRTVPLSAESRAITPHQTSQGERKRAQNVPQAQTTVPPAAVPVFANLVPPPPSQNSPRKTQAASRRDAQENAGAYNNKRPPENTRPLIGVDIGFKEIAVFMPNWFLVPEVLLRLAQNRIMVKEMASAQLDAINMNNAQTYLTCRNGHQKNLSKVGKGHFRINGSWDMQIALNAGPENDLTANNWTEPTGNGWGDVPLSDIWSRVPRNNWPTGNDRLLLTQCLEFAAANPQYALDTSHWAWIVQTAGLQAPPAPLSQNRDEEAIARMR